MENIARIASGREAKHAAAEKATDGVHDAASAVWLFGVRCVETACRPAGRDVDAWRRSGIAIFAARALRRGGLRPAASVVLCLCRVAVGRPGRKPGGRHPIEDEKRSGFSPPARMTYRKKARNHPSATKSPNRGV